MKFEQALKQVVKEGAIRIWRVSGGWQIAYRITDGKIEARGLHLIDDDWKLAELLVSSKTYREANGWYAVSGMHQSAEPIISPGVEENAGYFIGMTRQCHSCKKYRPVYAFNKDKQADRKMRSWECDKCAGERELETDVLHSHSDEHVGDYLSRKSHASRPPVRGEV